MEIVINQNTIIAFAGVVTAIAVIITNYNKLKKAIMKPVEQLNERVGKIEATMNAHDGKLISDKEDLESLSEAVKLLIRSQMSLTRHAIDGNNIEELKITEKELNNYLLNK